MKLGTVVAGYSFVIVILHCLFIAYSIFELETECIPNDRIRSVEQYDVAHFIAWGVLYFPLLALCAFYVAVLKTLRSVCCCCWRCCGRNVDGSAATKCKICIDGVFGNPLIFAVAHSAWGVYEWISLSDCGPNLNYGFGLDVVLIAISLLLLCVWYFVRTKRGFEQKQKERVEKRYDAQLQADNEVAEGRGRVRLDRFNEGGLGNAGRRDFQSEGAPGFAAAAIPAKSYSEQSGPGLAGPKMAAPQRPQYAHSAHGVSPYRPAPPPQPGAPVYASSAHGVAPYRPQNRLPPHHEPQDSGPSVEISVELEESEVDAIPNGARRTRGPSISFPSQFRGHARRVSSGILDILKRIDAEPECTICMDDLSKGDAMGQLECGHAFHKQCIVDWLRENTSCPMCRETMTK